MTIRLFITIAAKYLRRLTISETALDIILCMPIDVVAQGWLQPPSKSCIVVMFKQFIPKMINNETLEMLTAREQLMEDITATLDQYFQTLINECNDMGELDNFEEAKDALTFDLCDDVCKNFPC